MTTTQQQVYSWQTYDLAQIWNDPDPIFEFLAGSVAMRPSVNLWYGAPGSFKTLLLQDLALCISAKSTWLDPKPGDNVTPMEIAQNYPILWIDQDSGETVIRNRFKALAKGHGVMPKLGDISWLSCPVPPINLWGGSNSRTAKDALTSQYTILALAASMNAGFVGIDNLGAISGGADENSRDMLDVLTAVRQIAEWTNTSVNLVHHANKKGDRSQYGVRGHTSIIQSVDYAFEVTRDGIDDIATITCTKSRHIPVEPFSLLWTYENIGNRLEKARFFGIEPDVSSNPLQAAIDVIHRHFTDGMNQANIVNMVQQHISVSRHKVRSAIRTLERKGELDSTVGPKNSIVYFKSKANPWK